MATFVSQDPQTSGEQALHKSIKAPEGIADGFAWNCFRGYEIVEYIEGNGQAEDVPKNVAETSQAGSFEAMGWDSVSDVLDGEVWKLEFIPIGVQKKAIIGRIGG